PLPRVRGRGASDRLLRARLFASLPEGQQAVADLNLIALLQLHRLLNALAVEERPARSAGILQVIALTLQHDPRMQPFDAGVAEEADVARLRPANGDRRTRQDHLSPGTKALHDLHPCLFQ